RARTRSRTHDRRGRRGAGGDRRAESQAGGDGAAVGQAWRTGGARYMEWAGVPADTGRRRLWLVFKRVSVPAFGELAGQVLATLRAVPARCIGARPLPFQREMTGAFEIGVADHPDGGVVIDRQVSLAAPQQGTLDDSLDAVGREVVLDQLRVGRV